ncbi:LCP family protein [Jatrophihabitans sp.]|uniref:LCP family protein n=1 Tax=Jatrophihabitans sp. TaxID=1932789 RepID=UPI0030C6CC42|nr:Cell envelope-related function transcriptional attenuator common domain [Jatrophihabitans sp.]
MRSSSSRHGVPGDRIRLGQIGRASTYVIAALLSLAILVAFGYGWKNYRDLNGGLQKFQLNSLNKPPATVKGGKTVTHKEGSAQNILIVGLDDRAGLTAAQIKAYHTGTDVSDSTDSIMIVHVPADGTKATLISIPREAYVDIPGYKKNLINAAYADGKDVGGTGTAAQRQGEGFDLLVQTVEQLTGLSVNHFVAVGFSGFVAIADAIHGVEVNLCYSQDDRYSGLHVPAGPQRLDGAQSLAFVRQRHNINGGQSSDLTRAERQRYFLAAAFKQIASIGVLTNPGKLSALIKAVTGSIYVDEGFSLVTLAEQMADLSAGNINGHVIPTTGDVTTLEGQDGLGVKPAKVQAFVQNLLYPPAKNRKPSSSASGSSSASPSTSPSSSSGAVLTKGCIH